MCAATEVSGQVVFPSYARYPISFVKGKGSYLWDKEGKQYLDFVSGIAVTNLGHAPEKVKAAVAAQLEQLWHTSNLYDIPNQYEAGEWITKHSCGDAVFFCNSGAEANEAAIKLARRYQQKIAQTGRYEIITFHQSFHGRTLATLTATGQDKVKDGFGPLPEGFVHATFNDIASVKAAITSKTAAIMFEFVQAEGGVYPADQAFVNEVAKLCKEQGILLVIDEVQTGIGRTGKLFAYEHYGVEPDIFTLAKGLGSGFPVGAMVAKEYLRPAFSAGSHGSTFGGTPLATAAVKATLQTIIEDNVLEQAAKRGQYLQEQLKKHLLPLSFVKDVRGLGLLIGIECQSEVASIVVEAQIEGLLILNAGPNVIRLLPNLLVTETEINQAVSTLAKLLKDK